MNINRIAVFGGTGFVGTHLCNRLIAEGYQLKVFTRNRARRQHDTMLLSGLDLVEMDVYSQEQLNTNLHDCDAVINLVGILNERGRNGEGFRKAHVELVEKIIAACEHNNIKRFLQLSALKLETRASYYLRTKHQAEELLHSNSKIAVTSFRPSVIFGANDSFFNQFATLLKLSPILPLACHNRRFAPVYVMDVIAIITNAINDPKSHGKKFNLCGPEIYTLYELVTYTKKQIKVNRLILPLNNFLSRLQGYAFDLFGVALAWVGIVKPFSMDNYNSMSSDNVCDINDFAVYDIKPSTIDAVVPSYLAPKDG